MEFTLILSGMAIVSTLAGYGYYLVLEKEIQEFEVKKKAKTEYRTNEEFVNIQTKRI